jgi:uncharacterized protein YeaO (DUF488 family)
MIKVKNLFDPVESDDGVRLFVEPTGLTRDLIEWCGVHHVLGTVAPPQKLASFLEQEPADRYDAFRGQYHDWLSESKFMPALDELARAARDENYTFLHTGDDPNHNVASALAEFLAERQGWKHHT